MFDHMFTKWGTLSMDGLAFFQTAAMILCTAAIVAALYLTRRLR